MLQRITLMIIILFALINQSQGQTYIMSNVSGQTITTCSGNFYDSGGPSGGYAAVQTYTVTFCPSTLGAYVNINFTSWNVGSGDAMEIFDGPNTSSPSYGVVNAGLSPVGMIIGASILNPNGCITLRWNSTSAAAGWAATISCGLPCQNFTVGIQSSIPPFHLDSGIYYIDICPHDSVSITAFGTYNYNDSVYHQSDATTSFIWNLGNYITDTIQSVSTVYDTIRGYNVELSAIDSNHCLASQTPKVRVRLSTRPDFDGTTQIDEVICQGDTTNLFGVASTKIWKANASLNHAGITFLPDGSGASYTSTLVFNVFAPGQVLQNPNQIIGINAVMEHSYLGDLNIIITCPNNQSATLKSYAGGGGGTFLGEPVDDASVTAGVGYNYSWKPNGTTTMVSAVGSYSHAFTDAIGTYYASAAYLPPSGPFPGNATAVGPFPSVNYLPETNYSSLVGCPLNGTWTITVTDNLFIDNGYIFSWGIDFAASVLPTSWSYEPAISSQSWNNISTIIANYGGQVTISPSDTGLYNYTYTVVDDFGCTYDTTVKVTVVPTPEVELGNDTLICGFGIVTIDATSSLTGATYSWNTGNLTAIQQTNISGNYIATVSYSTLGAVCSNSDTLHVDQYDMATLDLGNDTCVYEPIELHAGNLGHNPAFLYNWSDGSTGESLLVTQPGTYSVTVAIDPNTPCTVEDEINVSIYNEAFLGADESFCSFEEIAVEVPVDNSTLNHSYNWKMDGSPLNITNNFFAQRYISAGTHTLTVNVDNGCTDEIILTSKDCTLEIPNIITPNGDASNDVFKIDGLENFTNSELIIYNRWGKKVYQISDYHNDWGDPSIADGVYYYVLRTTVADKKEYKGTLTILKK